VNWLAWDPIAFAGALLGLAAGLVAYAELGARGIEAPWIVGLASGGACALFARDKSMLRGVVVAIAAVWAAAFGQSWRLAAHTSVLVELSHFHESLGLWRLLEHLAGAGAALVCSSQTVRRNARARVAGS